MDERERRIRTRLRDDFPHYATKCLTIKEKKGGLAPFELNRAQLYLHARLSEQLEIAGMIRALVLKGRQQGASTYTEGRFFHRTTHRRGVKAFILTHHTKATHNLFGMAKRFYQHCPALVRPHAGYSNSTELVFDRLDSRYSVGTAGSVDVGRSDNIQFFHGSEVAMWKNAADHKAGVMQAIPRAPGTEVILESTAKGVGGVFHVDWQEAEAGKSDFIPIFLPWYWQPEYVAEADFLDLTGEEQELTRLYGLTIEQLAWRRLKLQELGPWRFKQEYPFHPAEAFQSGNEHPYITPDVASSAVGRLVDDYGMIVLGVDPSRKGKDRFCVQVRRGPILLATILIPAAVKQDSMAATGAILRIFNEWGASLIGMDEVGLGGPVADRLRELGLPVVAVNAGTNNALDRTRFSNLQTEMYSDLRDWLATGSLPADNEHLTALLADISAPSFDYDSNGRDRLEGKESLATRGLRSPDLADALAISIIAERMWRGQELQIAVY